jgi:hypothetical protein
MQNNISYIKHHFKLSRLSIDQTHLSSYPLAAFCLHYIWSVMLIVPLISGCLKNDNSKQNQSFIKFYGNSDFSKGSDVKQTTDGGYIVVGTAGTINRGTDVILIKTDSYGNQEWSPKFFGGALNDSAYSIQVANDGGYIIAGSEEIETNGIVTSKIFVVKTDAQGDTIWTKVIGGNKNDVANFVQLNGNNGYLVTGYSESFGNGGKSAFLISLGLNGNIIWIRTYGSNSDYNSKCVQLTKDGYILIGSTKYTSLGSTNIFVARTNTLGLLLQTSIIGGTDNISGEYIQVLPGGGFIGIGTKRSADNSYSSIRLFKLGDAIDSVLWAKDYGKTNERNEGKSVQITSDNGYVFAGTKDISGTNSNFYLIKTDSIGNILFSRDYGQSGLLHGENILQTKDGGFILIGTNTIEGYSSITLIKVMSNGELN